MSFMKVAGDRFSGLDHGPTVAQAKCYLVREPGDCGLGMGFDSPISLCEKFPNGIKTKLHFIDIMNHEADV